MIVVGLVLSGALHGAAQEAGYWRAASNNAVSITGDLQIRTDKLTIDYASFPLAQIRALKPEEASAVFDADNNSTVTANLYRLDIPAGKQLLHHNTLCGTDDTQWMVTFVSGRSLQVAFFSGSQMPVLTVDALNHASSLCGIFEYVH
jgi:hypothetical protein